MVHVNIKIPARTARIFTDKARSIGFFNRGFEAVTLKDILAAYIDITGVSLHSERGN